MPAKSWTKAKLKYVNFQPSQSKTTTDSEQT